MKTKKLVFGYYGGEKSVLTAEGMSNEDITNICNSIANATQPYVVLDIPTSKNDILLINKPQLLFFYATDGYDDTNNKKNTTEM